MKSQLQRALRQPLSNRFPSTQQLSWKQFPAYPRRPTTARSSTAIIVNPSHLRGLKLWSTSQRRSVRQEKLETPLLATGRFQESPDFQPEDHLQLKGSISQSLLIVVAVALASAATYLTFLPEQYQEESTERVIILSENTMAQIPEGRPGNLTPEQEEKLRKLWVAVFQLCGVTDSSEDATPEPAAKEEQPEPEKKRRFGMFRKNKESKSSTPAQSDSGEDDKYGQTKQYYEALAKHSPETIRETIWSMVKHDHPDALVLRFLRARKWDVDKALVMLVSTMSWRHSEMHVDDDIMKNGEAGAKLHEASGDANEKKLGTDFLAQIRMGKSFLHGTDKMGRPICVVRVRLHKQGEQCEESLEKYTVYIIETARMVLAPPVDTATIIFDMTGFSMANMDYTPVQFMIKCFEANYPESLGTVLVHNAPWVFQGIWKIIKGWLDPVVAAKVHFTNNKGELEQFIEPGKILKELGGDENWEYTYVEPVEGENEKMKDTETRGKLLKEREEVVKQFEAATLEWIQKPDETTKAKREQLAAKLRDGYWVLDPYVRSRSLYDRLGNIQTGGSVDWYKPTPAATNATTTETSPDDVD